MPSTPQFNLGVADVVPKDVVLVDKAEPSKDVLLAIKVADKVVAKVVVKDVLVQIVCFVFTIIMITLILLLLVIIALTIILKQYPAVYNMRSPGSIMASGGVQIHSGAGSNN